MEERAASPELNGSPAHLRELEALIFASRVPITPAVIRRALPDLTPARVAELVARINESLSREGRPYEIVEVAGGYQFRTRPEFSEVIRATHVQRTVRMSKAALETLAVVAYRQPITRAEMEEVRSVDCGAVLRGLLDRGLVRIAGRRDAPGRPALYGTTARFLETFALRSLSDLPPIGELRERVLSPSDAAEEADAPVEDPAEPSADVDEDEADDPTSEP